MNTKEEKKPFIKLIKSPNGYYIYEVGRNEVIPVEKETFRYLDRLLHGESCEEQCEEAEKLRMMGYLSTKHVETIEHSMTPYLPIILERRLQKITLQLTQDCNFRCKYCHYTMNDGTQRVHSKKKMDFDMVKKGILFLRDHSVDSPEVYIGFYGGEPLLVFDMLKKAVEYAEEMFEGKKINFTVTTNATLFSKEIIEFFEQHHIQTMISLDGPKEIHDKNRVFENGQGTFDSVMNKVNLIRIKYPKFFKEISFSMVIDPQNDYGKIDKLFKEYPFLKRMNITATVVDDISIHKNIYSEEYVSKAAYKEFLAYLHVLDRIPLKKLDPVTKGKVISIRKTMSEFQTHKGFNQIGAPGGPCVPGEVRLMLTTEGNFIVCERVNEISDCMILGNINKGIDVDKAYKLLNVAQVTQEACKNCWAFWGCNLCAKYSDKEGVLSKEQRLSQCKQSQNSYYHSIQMKIMFKEAQEIYDQIINL